MNWRGTDAADHLVDELEAGALGSGSTSMSQTRELAVAAGLLDVAAVALAPCRANVSRSGTRSGTVVDARRRTGCAAGRARRRRAPRPCTTARAGGSRRCARGAASGPRRPAGSAPATACPRRPWTSRADRDRQQRLGHRPRLDQQRVVLVGQRVAGLGAGQLGDRADVAGDALRRPGAAACPAARTARRSARPRRGRRGRARRRNGRMAGHVHGGVGPSVPEKTRTRLTRPT